MSIQLKENLLKFKKEEIFVSSVTPFSRDIVDYTRSC